MKEKTYIGDGLYVRFDGFGYEVTSENGEQVLDRVYFEPTVLRSFIEYTGEAKN